MLCLLDELEDFLLFLPNLLDEAFHIVLDLGLSLPLVLSFIFESLSFLLFILALHLRLYLPGLLFLSESFLFGLDPQSLLVGPPLPFCLFGLLLGKQNGLLSLTLVFFFSLPRLFFHLSCPFLGV